MSPEQDVDAQTRVFLGQMFGPPPPKITATTQPTLSETLWRCTVCGKWSHAKRRPRHHERSTMDPESDTENGVVLRTEEYQEDADGGWAILYWMACGPFEKWEAWKVESG